MTSITSFAFNPFYENTYVVSAANGDCWIIDPGCYTVKEQEKLVTFITDNGLKPVKLLNTHCHLDHIFGNAFIADKFNLKPEWHEKETTIAQNAKLAAMMFGVKAPEYRQPGAFLIPGDTLELGDASFKILFTPGHSPGSVTFYNEAEKFAIAGDVLFQGSIGRTDLPGGDYDTLIESIKRELLALPDDVAVYNGHGAPTTIGQERLNNPFLR